MRRCRNVGVALIGLLVVAAISVAAGSGRKLPKEQQAAVSLRRISESEVMDIIHKFPEIVPSYMDTKKYSADILAQAFPLSEVTAAPLKRVFPAARFYKGLDLEYLPPAPYMMAVCGGKRYPMYGGFNYLLVDNGLKVTDENILALAQAFVISVLGGDQVLGELGGERELLAFRQVVFLDAKRIAEVRSGISYDAKLKVKVGERVEEWYFDRYFDEFRVVSRGDEKGLILQYLPPFADPPPQRGMLVPRPRIGVDTLGSNAVRVEWQDTIPHYYAIVEENHSPTGRKVTFFLKDFPPDAQDVYVRVIDTIRNNTIRLLDTVHIDGLGNGTYVWDSVPACSTGIFCAGAGFADDTNPEATYQDTAVTELTTEKVLWCFFPGSLTQMLNVFYNDQFFRTHPDSEAHADSFAEYVKNAMLESWQRQVNEWGFPKPPDADSIHLASVTDSVHWYHGLP